MKYNKQYHIILSNNEKHIFQLVIKLVVVSLKNSEEIKKSKEHPPSNTPWRKEFPPVVSQKSMHYSVMHEC